VTKVAFCFFMSYAEPSFNLRAELSLLSAVKKQTMAAKLLQDEQKTWNKRT